MIYIKSDTEIEKMRVAGRILAKVHEAVAKKIAPGVTTKELDKVAYDTIIEHGARPSFLGLYDYPATINASVNEEVIHGIPGPRRLKEGDIISVDIGVYIDGFHSDAARTHAVGKISDEAARLIEVTRQSFFEALKCCREGMRVGDISSAVQSYVEAAGYGVLRNYTGHGVGKKLHEDPSVPNYGSAGRGPRLQKGMVIAIEPMVTQGTHKNKVLDDNWTVVTLDGKLSAHYENTVVITDGEPEVLTLTEGEKC